VLSGTPFGHGGVIGTPSSFLKLSVFIFILNKLFNHIFKSEKHLIGIYSFEFK